MNKITLILLAVILTLLIYLALKPNNEAKYLEMLSVRDSELAETRNKNLEQILFKLDSLRLIQAKETIIRNYYNEIIMSADSISNDVFAVSVIRKWLDSLGTARLD